MLRLLLKAFVLIAKLVRRLLKFVLLVAAMIGLLVVLDAIFGPEPQKFNAPVANFEKLRGSKTVKLNGDHDVFGDGSVMIMAAPGHTPGHQVLVVRLPKRGPVMLTGDMVHLVFSWNNRIVPSFNFDVAQSGRSIDAMKAYAAQVGAQVWVNHDKEQHADIPKAPAWVE